MSDKIQVVLGDITTLRVDAIVNAANTSLLGGGGVDGAIHAAAGPQLLEECKTLGGCATGDARITAGHNLPAKFVIHAVGPVWQGGMRNEEQLLKSVYIRCLELAVDKAVRTIAFPAISTGGYRFPSEPAARIACKSAKDFITRNPTALDQIIFCCFDQKTFEIYQQVLAANCAPPTPVKTPSVPRALTNPPFARLVGGK